MPNFVRHASVEAFNIAIGQSLARIPPASAHTALRVHAEIAHYRFTVDFVRSDAGYSGTLTQAAPWHWTLRQLFGNIGGLLAKLGLACGRRARSPLQDIQLEHRMSLARRGPTGRRSSASGRHGVKEEAVRVLLQGGKRVAIPLAAVMQFCDTELHGEDRASLEKVARLPLFQPGSGTGWDSVDWNDLASALLVLAKIGERAPELSAWCDRTCMALLEGGFAHLLPNKTAQKLDLPDAQQPEEQRLEAFAQRIAELKRACDGLRFDMDLRALDSRAVTAFLKSEDHRRAVGSVVEAALATLLGLCHREEEMRPHVDVLMSCTRALFDIGERLALERYRWTAPPLWNWHYAPLCNLWSAVQRQELKHRLTALREACAQYDPVTPSPSFANLVTEACGGGIGHHGRDVRLPPLTSRTQERI